VRAVLLAAALSLTPLVAPAAEAPKRPVRNLALDEVVFLAVKNNVTLQAERINPQRAHTVVVEQTAVFDPIGYSEFTRRKSRKQTPSALFGEAEDAAEGRAGLQKLFPLGTVVDVHASSGRTWDDFPFAAINPAYESGAGWSVTQPLLRGFGVKVNTAGIETAKNERRISQAQLRDAALDIVLEAKNTYWELVYSIGNRDLLQRSLERALNLQRDVEARVEAKVLGERDPAVSQAKAEVATRREALVIAEDTIRDNEENLKVITDLVADPAAWALSFNPTTPPPRAVPDYDPQHAVNTALANRPDYQQARLFIENQTLAVYVRRNELRPQLNASFGIDNSGLSGSAYRSRKDLGTMDYYEWTLSLGFEYPLGNRAARSRYRRARLEKQQAEIGLIAIERRIQLEVRNAIRDVETSVERLKAGETSVEAETERLRAEEIRFKEAKVGTTQDVLDAQAALADAERRTLRALINLNQAVTQVQRTTGTLLGASNVVFEEE
jgi:outer membrane protein TolC